MAADEDVQVYALKVQLSFFFIFPPTSYPHFAGTLAATKGNK